MKKVQSLITTTKCLMNPSLSFSGKASRNFLNGEFMLLLFGRKTDYLKKSLPSPYFKAKDHRDSWKAIKQKSPISYQNRAFEVGPEGLEPPTR